MTILMKIKHKNNYTNNNVDLKCELSLYDANSEYKKKKLYNNKEVNYFLFINFLLQKKDLFHTSIKKYNEEFMKQLEIMTSRNSVRKFELMIQPIKMEVKRIKINILKKEDLL